MGEEDKRVGVTHAIRMKLDFLDERLWKRFSARRLELIDTLDLSLKKASEQEAQIKLVAEVLRLEFGYDLSYEHDFDRLVRAAVQSVRRNRKRSSKSKKHEPDAKRPKLDDDILSMRSPESLGASKSQDDEAELSDGGTLKKFLLEIARINSDSHDDIYDMNYPRTLHFSTNDQARAAIDTMIKPRISSGLTSTTYKTVLPPIAKLQIQKASYSNAAVKAVLINHIERSKSCSESVSKKSDNLQFLGQSVISTCIGYVFEKSFENINDTSVEYLRNKLRNEPFLANFFRELDPTHTGSVSDDIAVITLYTLMGGCVKDFGFETIMFPLCEMLYLSILEDYPLISKNSTPFTSIQAKNDYTHSLSSLAAVASDIKLHEQSASSSSFVSEPLQPPLINTPNSRSISPEVHRHPPRKQVLLKFLSSVLEFSYPTQNSAPPRYIEIIENARLAFKLSTVDTILGLRNVQDDVLIQTDSDLERIFKGQDKIELEIFTQRSKAIPIHEITSARESTTIILPPPFQNRQPVSLSRMDDKIGGGFNFLSNLEDSATPPPPPLLPKFQPLL